MLTIKRIVDIIVSLVGIFLLFPLLITLALLILFTSKGNPIFKQKRVGKNNKDFYLYKFRTMFKDAEQYGQITTGDMDSRITPIGYWLRKYKFDELPQLFNVFFGNMSLVGPRPEVRKYVEMYTQEQKKVLSVTPGITDYASIEYANENEILGKTDNPLEVYVNEIMPAKLALNLKYLKEQSLWIDLNIIFKTLKIIHKK